MGRSTLATGSLMGDAVELLPKDEDRLLAKIWLAHFGSPMPIYGACRRKAHSARSRGARSPTPGRSPKPRRPDHYAGYSSFAAPAEIAGAAEVASRARFATSCGPALATLAKLKPKIGSIPSLTRPAMVWPLP